MSREEVQRRIVAIERENEELRGEVRKWRKDFEKAQDEIQEEKLRTKDAEKLLEDVSEKNFLP